jgi:glycosyltransferase involved in cell wall biosynthesis
MKIGIVIPWREQPSRVRAFEAVKNWYTINLPEATIYTADRPGPVWNMSGSRNDGVRLAEADGCDVIVMSDADTIPQIRPLEEAIQAAYRDNMIHNSYNQYRILGYQGTEQFFAGGTDIMRCQSKVYDTACSGIHVFTPKGWWDLGGNDEKFQEWGYEDTAFQHVHTLVHGVPIVKHRGIAFSLGHEPQRKEGEHYNRNKDLYQEYKRITSAVGIVEFVKGSEYTFTERWKKMSILFYVEHYPPMMNAGGELTAHQIARDLVRRGHDVLVFCKDPTIEELEGVKLKPMGEASKFTSYADLIITQFEATKVAMSLAKQSRKPLVHLIHNDMAVRRYNLVRGNASLVVSNSDWVRNTIGSSVDSMVLYPPTHKEDYGVKPKNREYITLVNLVELKGASIFWQLARIMPDKKFLAVEGGYGEQIIPDNIPSNVTLVKNTTDMSDIYAKTKIVIMPSSYESWGRVAIEAACSGIPTIAAPTPGLKESLSYSGIFVEDRNNVADWVEAIKSLDDENEYKKYSELVKKRVSEIDFDGCFDTLENRLLRVINQSSARRS